MAFPGQAEGRVTLSWTLGQLADRQAPDAISGGAWLSAQFPFFHPLSETGEGKGVDVTSPQPQKAPGGGLGTRSGTAGRLSASSGTDGGDRDYVEEGGDERPLPALQTDIWTHPLG